MSSDGSNANARIFVGVKVTATADLDTVMAKLNGLGDSVRVVRREQLHVTLNFLGDTEESLIPVIVEGLKRACAGIGAFDWTLHGIGAFPSSRRPSVVWAGAEDGRCFASLAEAVQKAVEPLGFTRESRAFHPHVTVARVKFRPPPELKKLIDTEAETVFGPQCAEEVILFRSELGRRGPVYTPLGIVKLSETSE